MELTFNDKFKEYCIENYNYDPANDREVKSLSHNYIKKGIENMDYPKNDDLSNLIMFNVIKCIENFKEKFIEEKKEIIHRILSFIYSFFDENLDLNDSFYSLKNYVELPFQNSKEIRRCFESNKDFYSFLVFNFILIFDRHIDEKLYSSTNFILLDALILYENAFFNNKINIDKRLQISIAKIISTIFKVLVEFQEQNMYVANLNSFFFNDGITDIYQFLKPNLVKLDNKEEEDNMEKKIQSAIIKFESLIEEIINVTKLEVNLCNNAPTKSIKDISNIDRELLMEEKENTDIRFELNDESKEESKESINKISGYNITDINEITKLLEEKFSNQINNLNRKVEILNDDNAHLRNRVGALNGLVGTLNGLVGTLNEKVGTLNEEVGNLNEEVVVLKSDNTKLEKLNSDNENCIVELNDKIKNLIYQIKNKELTITLQDSQLLKQKEEIIKANKEKKYLSKSK